MALVDDLALFETQLQNCTTQLGEGSFLVAPLINCAKIPTVYELEITGDLAIDDGTVSVTVNTPTITAETNDLYLREGAVLTFTGGSLVVAQETVISTNTETDVPIEASPVAILATAADTTEIFSALEFLGISNSPLDFQIQTESEKTLKDGLQGATTKTSVAPQSSIEFFLRFDDSALWRPNFLFDTGVNNVRAYVARLSLSNRQGIIGPAEFTALSFQDQVDQLQKGTGTISYQTPWYTPRLFNYQTTAEKEGYNNLLNRFGLPSLV